MHSSTSAPTAGSPRWARRAPGRGPPLRRSTCAADGRAAGPRRPARPPAAAANAGLGVRAAAARMARALHLPARAGLRRRTAERQAPAAFRAFAAAGTTTALLYGALWEPSLDAAFRAAEAHGIRAIIGKVMMDRLTYDSDQRSPGEILDLSLRQSADLCARWHGRDGGRLRYAFTPRFAVSCSADMLRESAALAASTGAYWQTHLSEDHGEIAEVARLFPDAMRLPRRLRPGRGARAADDPRARGPSLGARGGAAGGVRGQGGPLPRVEPLPGLRDDAARPRTSRRGLRVGLGSDVAAGPDPSIFRAMRVGAYVQNARAGRRARLGADPGSAGLAAPRDARRGPRPRPGGRRSARSRSARRPTSSRSTPRSRIALPTALVPLPPADLSDPADLLSRLIFRSHPAWSGRPGSAAAAWTARRRDALRGSRSRCHRDRCRARSASSVTRSAGTWPRRRELHDRSASRFRARVREQQEHMRDLAVADFRDSRRCSAWTSRELSSRPRRRPSSRARRSRRPRPVCRRLIGNGTSVRHVRAG